MSTLPSQLLSHENTYSPEVTAAQQILIRLREKISRKPNKSSAKEDPSKRLIPLDFAKRVQDLPPHLGWDSQNVRQALPPMEMGQCQTSPLFENLSFETSSGEESSTAVSIPIFPEIAIALIKEKCVPVGRVWLLLRYLDTHGAGWLEVDEVKHQLTNKQSRFRVCGWRQMRNLLSQGDGLFWVRHNGRVWLRSLPKVAHALNIDRFTVDSVLLPLETLLAKLGTLRAHLFATFHSGRTEFDRAGANVKGTAPIARATIEAITQVSPRIQRLYERSAQVSNQSHFCIGSPFSELGLKQAAWQYGTAVFRFKDSQGLQGKAGCEYVAWQLPNSYAGPHQRQGKRQRKRINKRLMDLLTKGIVGNDQLVRSRATDALFERRYFANGRFASKATRSEQETPIYCPNQKSQGFWFTISTGDQISGTKRGRK